MLPPGGGVSGALCSWQGEECIGLTQVIVYLDSSIYSGLQQNNRILRVVCEQMARNTLSVANFSEGKITDPPDLNEM